MIEIEKIKQHPLYKESINKIKQKKNMDIEPYIEKVTAKAVEIAEGLNINQAIIKRAVLLTYLGLAFDYDDYIKTSGILSVKILSELGEGEDTIAQILMAIAGQGNQMNSVNILSAVILLAHFVDLHFYLQFNQILQKEIETITLAKWEIDYEKKEISYCFNLQDSNNKNINLATEYLQKIIDVSASVLHLKVKEKTIAYKN